MTNSDSQNMSKNLLDKENKKVSFIKQVHPNGQEGLSMLIEDMNTQNVRTITYVLDDVIEEDVINNQTRLKMTSTSIDKDQQQKFNSMLSMIAVNQNNTLLRPSNELKVTQIFSEVKTETDKEGEEN